MPVPVHTLVFTIADRSGNPEVCLSIDGAELLTAPFDQSFRDEPEMAQALGLVEAGVAVLEDLKMLGARLWASLSADDLECELRQQVRALRAKQRTGEVQLSIRLNFPPGLDELPWEGLYDLRGSTFLGCDRGCTIARSTTTEEPAAGPKKVERLRMLVVIPVGSGLRVEHERSRIEFALQEVADAIAGGKPQLLHGRVTPDRLAAELKKGYDIVHFIGHGTTSDVGVAAIRLNNDDGEEEWVPADSFVSLFQQQGVSLVFLNCCLSGQPSTQAGFAGLGPMLLGNGVPAVVAMRYEVPDDVAIRVATVFYQELLTGMAAGCPDQALQATRQAVLRNLGSRSARAVATPVCFVAQGSGQLFEMMTAPRSLRSPAVRPTKAPSIAIPDPLVAAVRDGRCIPVLGPDLLTSQRSGAKVSAIAVHALASRLAEQAKYPERAEELQLAERAGGWLDLIVLQRACQHFEQDRERYELTAAVLEARGARIESPPVYDMIASWTKLPGLVCTYFDGLVEQAFERQNRRFCVAHAIDERVEGRDPSLPLLICLRGSVWNVDSLVLTEQDHDVLWEKIVRPVPDVASLVSGQLGRSLLFLGVSPRDTWVRRFVRQLLPPSARNIGPAFFVGPRVSGVDKACWQALKDKWKVHWIEADPDVFVEELTRRALEDKPA